METNLVIQLSAIFFSIVIGALISPKAILKLACAFVVCGILGVIIASIIHSDFVWIFGISVMAVPFLTAPALITSSVVSKFRKNG